MSRIDELIKQYCPDGVEKVRLGDVCTIERGKRVVRAELSLSGTIPVYQNSLTPLGYYNQSNYPAGTAFIISAGAAGEVGCSKVPMWAADDCIVVNHNSGIDSAYIYYVLKEREFFLKSLIRGGAIKRLSKDVVVKLEIPLPPLPVQEEIIRTLDKFTSLIEKLDEEIKLRQKQYEFYREKLLTFEEGEYEWKKIKEIGKLVRGNGLQKKDFTECGTGCIHYGQIYTKLGFSLTKPLTYVYSGLAEKLTKVEPGNLVIACTSENVEDVCKSVVWLGTETIVTGGHACVLKHAENPKYIGYCFLTRAFQNQKRQYAYGAKVIDIKTEKIGEIKLPIPSLAHQQQIVATLDKFEELITNLKEVRGLRQKQYEYYREKLLTF